MRRKKRDSGRLDLASQLSSASLCFSARLSLRHTLSSPADKTWGSGDEIVWETVETQTKIGIVSSEQKSLQRRMPGVHVCAVIVKLKIFFEEAKKKIGNHWKTWNYLEFFLIKNTLKITKKLQFKILLGTVGFQFSEKLKILGKKKKNFRDFLTKNFYFLFFEFFQRRIPWKSSQIQLNPAKTSFRVKTQLTNPPMRL